MLQRLHGSSLSPYDQEAIDYIVSTKRKPIDTIYLNDYYRFDIYEELNPRTPYIVGIDCSTGTNSDNNAMTILDPFTIKPVAEFKCSYIGETKFEKLIIALVDLLPRAVICIERNSVGDGIIDHLLESRIAQNLYYDKAKDLVEEENKSNQTYESMLKKQAGLKTYYGVYTGTQSRDDMFAILARHINEYPDNFITENIITDIANLVRTRSGKIAAAEGKHDDSIMSYLIALYVRYHGNNLPLFGIYLGASNEELNNKGIKHADEINPSLVDKKLIDGVRQQEEMAKSLNYEEMMRNAILRSQQESVRLYNSSVINTNIYENTPKELVEDINISNKGNMSLFDDLNGLNNYNNPFDKNKGRDIFGF